MIIRTCNNIIFVKFDDEPGLAEEISKIISVVDCLGGQHICADFSFVQEITSSAVSSLMKLYKKVADSGNRLILCSITEGTENVLRICGVKSFFETTKCNMNFGFFCLKTGI